jgi:GTP-binding protein
VPSLALLQRAEFFRSVHELVDLPPDSGIEVAFAGRSNAGKSSALNKLANRSRLAFTSKTPGRTQQIVFFRLDDERFLVDLPGYGFAGVPRELKQHWRTLLETYLTTRRALAGLVLIMDSRHPLTPLDRQMLEWVAPLDLSVHVLLSKCDKLGREARSKAFGNVRKDLAALYPAAGTQLFSSVTGEGLDEAQARLAGWLKLELEIKTPG